MSTHSLAKGVDELNDLTQLRWKNRLLIIWSQQPQKDYNQMLAQFREQINERDMAIFMISQSDLVKYPKQKISTHFLDKLHKQFPREKGRYFLIGKDGGLKSYGEVLDLASIFSEIDRMPMRRQEIKNRAIVD